MRILFISGVPGDTRLGAARASIELGEAIRQLGHGVEYVWAEDVPQRRPRTPYGRRFGFPFVRAARAVVARRASGFDVLDATEGHLPFAKAQLGFNGLLVARSVGLALIYDEFNRSIPKRWPDYPRSRLVVRPFRDLQRLRSVRHAKRSLAAADLINVPNADEAQLLESLGFRNRVLMLPLGLSAVRARALREAAARVASRRAAQKVVFVGMWTLRKGAYEWSEIVRKVRTDIPNARFVFLGTCQPAEVVWRDLRLPPCDWIEVKPTFEADDLPALLSDASVGAFPSYVEAFGLAVLEKLAAGLPTVAYDANGAREILAPTMPEMLVSCGDAEAFADRLIDVLKASERTYRSLSERAQRAAEPFRWPQIAEKTIQAYAERLAVLRF